MGVSATAGWDALRTTAIAPTTMSVMFLARVMIPSHRTAGSPLLGSPDPGGAIQETAGYAL